MISGDPLMFTTSQDDAIQFLAARVIALQNLLILKGIVTAEEVERFHNVTHAQMDQHRAQKLEEVKRENPGLAALLRILGD